MNEWWIDRDILNYRFVYIVFIHCVQENLIIVFYWNIYLRVHVEI